VKQQRNLLLVEEWFRPISANDRIIGSRDILEAVGSLRRSCWCRWRRNKTSLT